MTDYTNALARLLMQQHQPQDEFSADYASSAPLEDPRWAAARGAGKTALGLGYLGLGGAATGPIPNMLSAFGVGSLGSGGYDLYRAYQQMQGSHPDQSQMDRDLAMMSQYGQPPRGFGPK